jgi:hypothetical protein
VLRRMVVRLDSPRQLFEALPVSPMSDDYTEFTAQPAMITVRDLMLMRKPSSRDEIELVVVLPDDQITPTLDDELTVAVRRWVRVQNLMDSESSGAGGAVGRRLFLLGVAIFLVMQTAAIYLRNYSDATNDDPLAAIAEGISVTSWVMLWFPVQTFTVEMWRSSIRRRRTMTMERMSVVTVPASADDHLD